MRKQAKPLVQIVPAVYCVEGEGWDDSFFHPSKLLVLIKGSLKNELKENIALMLLQYSASNSARVGIEESVLIDKLNAYYGSNWTEFREASYAIDNMVDEGLLEICRMGDTFWKKLFSPAVVFPTKELLKKISINRLATK